MFYSIHSWIQSIKRQAEAQRRLDAKRKMNDLLKSGKQVPLDMQKSDPDLYINCADKWCVDVHPKIIKLYEIYRLHDKRMKDLPILTFFLSIFGSLLVGTYVSGNPFTYLALCLIISAISVFFVYVFTYFTLGIFYFIFTGIDVVRNSITEEEYQDWYEMIIRQNIHDIS